MVKVYDNVRVCSDLTFVKIVVVEMRDASTRDAGLVAAGGRPPQGGGRGVTWGDLGDVG